MEPLVLPDVSDAAWTSFQTGAPHAELPDHLRSCWARARQLGAGVLGPAPDDHLLRGSALVAHREPLDQLRAVGVDILQRATASLAALDHVLVLADTEGVVVDVNGGGEFAEHARRVRLMAGACWGEAVRGTNAIGTAATEGRETVVLGRAHFGRSFHQLACCAAPIRAADGRVIAVLDATAAVHAATPAAPPIVLAAARAIEDRLRVDAYAMAGAAVNRVLAGTLDRMTGAAVLVEPPGRIARRSRAAVELVGGTTELAAALGIGWHMLVAEALAPTTGGLARRLADGRDVWIEVEPVLDPRGGVLAVLVYLEPAGRSPHEALARARIATAEVRRSDRDDRATPVASTADGAERAFAPIISADPELTCELAWARRIAASEVPVMLLAETGSGKELVARAIHDASARRGGPFVAVNCGALAPSLLESELFGYAPGAFTGADRRGRPGVFQAASDGTLFLDEVAEMPAPMQVALLRVLESGTYQRLGEPAPQHTSVRVVCATCRDLPALVATGAFRQDLYYRLKGAVIRLPALRDRVDLDVLVEHLLGRLSARSAARAGSRPPTLSADAFARLAAHAWPGNVRELRAVLEVALVAAGDATVIEVEHLPRELAIDSAHGAHATPTRAHAMAAGEPLAMADAEAVAIERALTACNGNVAAAARALGVARSTIYRKLRTRA